LQSNVKNLTIFFHQVLKRKKKMKFLKEDPIQVNYAISIIIQAIIRSIQIHFPLKIKK